MIASDHDMKVAIWQEFGHENKGSEAEFSSSALRLGSWCSVSGHRCFKSWRRTPKGLAF